MLSYETSLTPELIAPLLELCLCEWCFVLKCSLDALSDSLALVYNLDSRVHQVGDPQIRAVLGPGPALISNDRLFCP